MPLPSAPEFGNFDSPGTDGPEGIDPRERAWLSGLPPDMRDAWEHPSQHAVQNVRTYGPEWLRNRAGVYQTQTVLNNINGTVDQLSPWLQQLGQQLPDSQLPATISEEIGNILNRLGQRGPSVVGGEHNRDAQYLIQEGRGEQTQYTVNSSRIMRDVRMLDSLRQTVRDPRQAQYLESLSDTLQGYGWSIDPMRMAVQQYNDMNNQSPLQQGTMYGLRFGTVLIAGTLAVINGIVSWKQDSPSVAPWLYAGMALFAANPSLLSGKAQRIANEANLAISGMRSEAQARRFDVRGGHWAEFAQHVMEGGIDPETMRLLRQADNRVLPEEGQAELLEHIAPEASTPADVRTGLADMLSSGRLPAFLRNLRGVRSEDARQLVSRYINDGAWRYEG